MVAPTYTFAADFALVRDQIRQMIGDVQVSTDPLISDEAIAFFYTQAGSLAGGALKAAKAAAAKLSMEFDKDLDGLKTSRSQRHKAMLDVIASLEAELAASNFAFTAPSAGDQAADVADYPTEFENTDISGPDWGAEQG